MRAPVRHTSFVLAGVILLSFFASVMIHFHLYKEYRSQSTFFSSMLYLPSGKYLKPASFGYDGLLADFIYLWSIQYYGDPGFQPKMEYLKHTYDIITELDPHYLDAYQTGALFMFFEGRNPQAGLDLLEQGMRKNPQEWILPMDAGFYCMMTLKRKDLAAKYFELASKIPTATSFAKRAQASMRFKLGDKAAALQLWSEVYDIAESPTVKQTAYQHMHDLRVLIDMDILRNAIAAYRRKFQRNPLNLEQLIAQRLLARIPAGPDGTGYTYDARTGEVKYATDLPLYKRYQ